MNADPLPTAPIELIRQHRLVNHQHAASITQAGDHLIAYHIT
jgi:hypothetical protein